MRALRFVISLLVISLFAVALLPSVVAQTKSHPVTGAELIALVASESLDQNIVHAIESRGIAFRPTEQYRALLTTAGADAPVMDALKSAKISADATFPEQTDSPEVLAHLAMAGKLIRAKQLEDAGKEIVAALNSRISPEAGFVMGHLQDQNEGMGQCRHDLQQSDSDGSGFSRSTCAAGIRHFQDGRCGRCNERSSGRTTAIQG